MPGADIRIETEIETGGADPVSRLSFIEQAVPQERKGPWPELRVVREASIDDDTDYGPEWDRYLNLVGKLNRGKGRARSLGSMGVTLVSAQEIGRMLSTKYPDVYETRRKTKQLGRRVGKLINASFALLDRERIDSEFAKLQHASDNRLAEAENRAGGVYEPLSVTDPMPHSEIDEILRTDLPSFAREGYFTCGEVGIFGSNRLAIDLSHNKELLEERNEAIAVLERQGLDKNLLDREWAPHIAPFETFANIGKVALEIPTEMPREILLERPRAIQNENEPN